MEKKKENKKMTSKKKIKKTIKTGKWMRFLKIQPDGWSSLDPAIDKELKNLSRNGRKLSSRTLYMVGFIGSV